MEVEYTSPLSLEYCAERIGYNAAYVGRVSRQQMGVSFKEYLYLFRIRKAQDLLVNTNLQIGEISQRLCYNNAQNFIRVFKRVVGVTPGVYRSNALGHAESA